MFDGFQKGNSGDHACMEAVGNIFETKGAAEIDSRRRHPFAAQSAPACSLETGCY
jgi:hypothetical protein